MASDEYIPTDLGDPELKGDVDYSFFGEDDEFDGDQRQTGDGIPSNKKKVIASLSSSASTDHTSYSTDSDSKSSQKESPKSPELAASVSSNYSKSNESSQNNVSNQPEITVRSESPLQQKSKSPSISRTPSPVSESLSSSRSRSSQSKSPSRSPSEHSKSKSRSRTPSPLSKSKSKSPSQASSKSVAMEAAARDDSSSKSKQSSTNDFPRKSEDSDHKRKGSHDDSDTTVTSLSEDTPRSSPKSGRKSSSRCHKGTDSTKKTRNEKEDLNSQRDNDIINAGLVMKAMLSIDRERKSKARSREAWLDPSFKERIPGEIINVEAENDRLVNYLIGRPTDRPCSTSLIVRPHHSTINRQEFQRRVETENRFIIKRLDAIHPTPGMKRTDQLEFYKTQSGYGVIPLDKAPLRRTRLTLSPLRDSGKASKGKGKKKKNLAKYPKTFSGAKSSRPEWISGW